MTPIAFTVYGIAQPKGSMRAYAVPGMRAPIITDGNRGVKPWQRVVADAAGAALERLPEEERRQLVGGVRCEIWYYLPRPKALCIPKYAAVDVPHITRPDLDKLTRAVLDALTAVLWADDAQVVELLATKRYAAPGAPARVVVTVGAARPLEATPLFDEHVSRRLSRAWCRERLSVSGDVDE